MAKKGGETEYDRVRKVFKDRYISKGKQIRFILGIKNTNFQLSDVPKNLNERAICQLTRVTDRWVTWTLTND